MMKKRKDIRSIKKTDLLFYICLVALPSLQFLIFYVGVNVNTIFLSFEKYIFDPETGRGWYEFNAFNNFRKIFENFAASDALGQAFLNSLIAYVTGTVVGVSLALVFSYYIYKKMFASKLVKVLLFLPSIISSVVMVLVFKYFANLAIPYVFKQIGITVGPLLDNESTAFGTVLFYNIWVGFGTSILMYSGAMSDINESVIEAAQVEGVGKFQEFIHIILPLIYPTLSVFIVTGIAGIFTNQLNLYSFYGPFSKPYTWTLGYYLFNETSGGGYADYPYLAAMGLLMTCIAVPLTFAVRWLLNRFGPTKD